MSAPVDLPTQVEAAPEVAGRARLPLTLVVGAALLLFAAVVALTSLVWLPYDLADTPPPTAETLERVRGQFRARGFTTY